MKLMLLFSILFYCVDINTAYIYSRLGASSKNEIRSDDFEGFSRGKASNFVENQGMEVLPVEEEDVVQEKRASLEGQLMSSAFYSRLKDSSHKSKKDLVDDMQSFGVIRIDNVLDSETVFMLKEFVSRELDVARAKNKMWDDYFSSSLAGKNRWDFKLPMETIVQQSLKHMLKVGAPLGDLLESLTGENGELFELASFITYPGAGRQVIHSDTLYTKRPVLFTCTVALQDIEESMGPTVLLPSSHTKLVHKKFDNSKTCDELLATFPHVLSTLSSGSVTVYDSRILHCGSANNSDSKSRILFYFSFVNPAGFEEDDDSWNVASIRSENKGKYCLRDFRAK